MKNLYKQLISAGTLSTYSNVWNKKIRLLNIYCLGWGHIVLIFYGLDVVSNLIVENIDQSSFTYSSIDSKAFFAHLTILSSLSLIFILNKKHHFKWARFLFMTLFLLINGYATLVVSPGSYLEYYFLLAPPIAITLYIKKHTSYIVLAVSFLLFLTPYYFYVVYPEDYVDRLIPFETICIFLVIVLIVNYFNQNNLNSEKLLSLERDKALSGKILLEKQKTELRELSEFKTHFYVNLSHEIRTPLTLIKGHSLQLNLNDSEEKMEEKINIINSQIEQVEFIINNIMDISKVDNKDFHLDIAPVNISSFFDKHYNNFKNLFEAKSVLFSLEDRTNNLLFKIDNYLFSKAINNLLNNALKFTKSGDAVVLKIYLEGKKLNVEVIDTGLGIPVKDIEKVFDRFFQSKNHITKSQGSGIGLSFTKSIIEAHDFTIGVKSISNISTIFSIQIPQESLQKSNSLEHTRVSQEANANEIVVNSNNSKIKILLVEDHNEMRNYIVSLLDDYLVTVAENGKVALEILKRDTFDVIITDYMMPVLDGKGLVIAIKKQNLKTPIIVLTARTDSDAKLKMLRLGIDAYLNKPFMKEELLMHIKKASKSFDVINKFDSKLKNEEKENLNKFAQKFNEDLNEFIFENMHSSLFSIDTIADHFNISKSTLVRKTKSLLGQVPKDIILEARFQKARLILEENPTESKKNISEAIGIKNSFYFFKKMEERFESK
jgi:signal transduction histidine kinase/DNA-binding NarL/FixJ family response regulator